STFAKATRVLPTWTSRILPGATSAAFTARTNAMLSPRHLGTTRHEYRGNFERKKSGRPGLHNSPTPAAVMGPANAQGAALAAETPGTGNRDKPHWHGPRIRRASPNERHD